MENKKLLSNIYRYQSGSETFFKFLNNAPVLPLR